MTKIAHVIRHITYEDLGSFESVLLDYGYKIKYFDAGYDDFLQLNNNPADLLVVMGGPIGVYEDADFPFIRDELSVLRHRLALRLPILAVCLGAQMLATALGAKVKMNTRPELGWAKVKILPHPEHTYFQHFENIEVLHWHQDTFDLPDKAILHASTNICKNQAFTVGNNILGLQFHPEVNARDMERWFIGNAHELDGINNITLQSLRMQTKQYAPALEKATKKFLAAWLNSWQSDK
jgi:GMP synthase (glutamine-hydrolysing)